MFYVSKALLLIGVIHLTAGFQPTDFHNWYLVSSVVVDDWLYIVGGDLVYGDNWIFTPYTYSIDLSSSWTTSDVQPETTTVPDRIVNIKRPILWYNPTENQVNMWGGLPWIASAAPGSYSFTPTDGGGVVWDDSAVPSSDGSSLDGLWGSAYATSPTTLYAIGGSDTYQGIQTPVKSMITNDLGTGTWTNETTVTGWADQLVFDSSLQYVPNFGKAGLLIALTGAVWQDQSSQQQADPTAAGMSSVDIYDIDSSTWYTQQTTGDIAPPAYDFGAVGLASEDQASYEIYVFGGATNDTFDTINPNDDAYRDVYILTLPAFTWVRTGQLSEERRDGMSCLVIGKSQMLIVGGNFFADAAKIKIDPWPNGMGIFDLNALEWTNGNYNHSAAPYQRAASVQAIYQQDSTPTWDDPALAAIFPFRQSLTKPTSTATTPSSQPTTSQPASSPSATSEPSHSKANNAGAIAGGVIGGLAAILIIVAAVWFVRRRRRQSSTKQHPGELQSGQYSPGKQQPGYTDTPALEMHGQTASRSELQGHPQGTCDEKEATAHGQGLYGSPGPGTTPELPGDPYIAR